MVGEAGDGIGTPGCLSEYPMYSKQDGGYSEWMDECCRV